MRHDQKICLSILAFSVLTSSASNTLAQSKAFPAYSPEPKLIEFEEESASEIARQPSQAGFPAFSESAQSNSKTQIAFPVAGIEKPASRVTGALDFQQLGNVLRQMNLDLSLAQDRYDFLYLAKFEEQELELSLSVLLGKEDSLLRIRAWLDPLPPGNLSAEPLLKMLSRNEELNRGLRFAYSKKTGRFLMEKTVPNQDITPEVLTAVFRDVSLHVADNWETWSTSQWESPSQTIIQESVVPAEIVPKDRFEMPIKR